MKRLFQQPANASDLWVIATIDSTTGVGTYTSIATDSNNKVHISYYDNNNQDLKYATNVSGPWVSSTLDSTNVVGLYTSIALDSNNKVHISYYDNTNYRLKYATNTSGAWVTSIIDSTGQVGSYTSIAIDSNNMMHISYEDITNEYLKYATNLSSDDDGDSYSESQGDCDDTNPAIHPGATEICNGVDDDCNGQIDEGFTISTYYRDLDGDNYGNPTNTLQLCARPGGYVTDNTDCNDSNAASNPAAVEICDGVDNNCNGEIDEGMADMDNDGYSVCEDCNDNDPTVNPGMTEIYYNGKDDDCNSATVDDDSDNDGYSGAGDCNDSDPTVNPGMAEIQNNCVDDDCNSATPDFNIPGWTIECVDRSGDTGLYTSIAADSNNKVHISYYDSTNADLKYATNISGPWVTSIIDSLGNVGLYTSIAIDSNNKLHISYYDNTNYDLKYATNASGAWVASIIDSTLTVGKYTSIAIDSNNKVHISYYDVNNADLKYATNASGTWVTFTVDSAGTVGLFTSIAIDSNNKVHISYYEAFTDFSLEGNLKYATNASGVWVTSILSWVIIGGYVDDILDTSIAIDSNNNAHISYMKNVYDVDGSPRIAYETNVSGSWVDFDISDAISHTSLAVDLNSKIHIIYSLNGLRYENNVSGTWASSTIDPTVYVKFESIAIDSNNYVHISYFDSSYLHNDLRYITNYQPSIDNDGDGYNEIQGDCDDNDANEYPGQTWYKDTDGDGFSDGTTNTTSCTRPANFKVASELTATSGDSNDDDPSIYPKIMTTGTASTYYLTLQEAYDAASSGDSIESETTSFTENLIIDLNKSVTLQGGYNNNYTAVTGKTTLNGNLNIISGTVTIGDFILQ